MFDMELERPLRGSGFTKMFSLPARVSVEFGVWSFGVQSFGSSQASGLGLGFRVHISLSDPRTMIKAAPCGFKTLNPKSHNRAGCGAQQ